MAFKFQWQQMFQWQQQKSKWQQTFRRQLSSNSNQWHPMEEKIENGFFVVLASYVIWIVFQLKILSLESFDEKETKLFEV